MSTTWGCHVRSACQLLLAVYLVVCSFQLRARKDHLAIFPFHDPLTIKSSGIHLDNVDYNRETKAAFCQRNSSYYDPHYIIRLSTIMYAKEKWVNFECAFFTHMCAHTMLHFITYKNFLHFSTIAQRTEFSYKPSSL